MDRGMKDWQKEAAYYWAKHAIRYPADDGVGYQYRPGIIRAVVADGTVDGRPSWENSPQVSMWLKEKRSIRERLRDWWRR